MKPRLCFPQVMRSMGHKQPWVFNESYLARCFMCNLLDARRLRGQCPVAIFSEQESQAVYLLKSQGISRIDVVNYISHGISKVEDGEEAQPVPITKAVRNAVKRVRKHFNLRHGSQRGSRAGRIDPLVGRSEELERVIQIICRRRKNNPCSSVKVVSAKQL